MNENEELRQRLGLDTLEAKEVRGFVELLLMQKVEGGGELSCHLVGCQLCHSLGSVQLPLLTCTFTWYRYPLYLVNILTLFS